MKQLLPIALLSLFAGTLATAAAQDGFEEFGSWDAAPALEPGVLPADTAPQARALWEALSGATLVPGSERAPVEAFDLTFDLVVNTKGSHQVNQARFLFRARDNWISSQLSPTNRLMRGPQGDWLIAKNETVKIQGREMAEDRRQLDDTLNVAHNFVKLTDPKRLRIARLAVAPGAPPSLPVNLVGRAAALEWLEVESPDLRLFRDSVRRSEWQEPRYRALLGLDAETRLPQIVLINEARQKGDLSRAMLVSFASYLPRDGYRIPHKIRTYQLDPRSPQQRFHQKPALELDLFRDRGSLRADALSPDDFVP